MSSSTAKHLAIVLLAASAPACNTMETPAPSEPVLFAAAPNVTVRGITDLGTFGMDHGFGFEISDAGNIAGRTETETAAQAVFWSPQGGAIPLPTLPGGGDSDTRALNNSNLVVGFSTKTGDDGVQRHPVVWQVSPGGLEITELGPFFNGQAEDVNDRGIVVGWHSTAVNGPPTGFRWSAREGLTSIPPVAGTRSTAAGINNGGDIVGSSTVNSPGPEHAVVWWRNGEVTDIGTLGFTAQARSINDHGEVSGFGRRCSLQNCRFEAFYWSEADGIIPLGTFGGFQSFSFEIDNQGRVTGRYDTGTPAAPVIHAFVWTKATGKVDLLSLGGPSSSTGSINARGQTTGWAEDGSGIRHAVIWQLGPGQP